MYMNCAYVKDSLLNYKDTSKDLVVGSCGTYHLKTISKLPTYRPHGRLDYQLIYIASGVGYFFFENGEETIIPAGNMILFRPKELQKYTYYGKDLTEVFWMHFSGSKVKNILRECGITDSMKIIRTGTNVKLVERFRVIIEEIQQKKHGYEEMIQMYCRQLFIEVARTVQAEKEKKNSFWEKEMENAQKFFDTNYNLQNSIEEYAKEHGMSVSWFIRCFRDKTKKTPLQYILEKRLANAQLLLETTDYSISEISEVVGYDNPLYFSRIFHKQKGMSPMQYRKLHM